MFKKCMCCEKNYIDSLEEACIDCDISLNDKLNSNVNNINELIIEEWGDNEFLNDLGASLIRR